LDLGKTDIQGLNYKSLWNRIWSSIPKFICWKIWLARNDLIFNNTTHTPQTVAAKAKAYLLEALNNHSAKLDTSLTPEERNWMGTLLTQGKTKILARPSSNPSWRIRTPDEEFQAWWRKKNKVTIFFDDASKGNPGTAGAGGIIYSHDGSHVDSFSWGLGQSTNNQAEILGLLKGCQIAQEYENKALQVFGDSEILIKIVNSKEHFANPALNKTLQRLWGSLQSFASFDIYHILRNSNKEADKKANEGCNLPQGVFRKNDEAPRYSPIP
jgi:ribonuclease HI